MLDVLGSFFLFCRGSICFVFFLFFFCLCVISSFSCRFRHEYIASISRFPDYLIHD